MAMMACNHTKPQNAETPAADTAVNTNVDTDIGGHEDSGDADSGTIGPVDPGAGHREPGAYAPRQAREIPAAPHIGKQADAGFGHGKGRAFGGDTVARRQGQADAAAHDDAVHEGDDRLAVFEHLVVELVFVVKEFTAAFTAVVERRIAQEIDVPARAEAAPFGVVENDGLHGFVIRPVSQRRADCMAHVERQRMQRLGPVKRDMAHPAMAVDMYFAGHAVPIGPPGPKRKGQMEKNPRALKQKVF